MSKQDHGGHEQPMVRMFSQPIGRLVSPLAWRVSSL